MMNIHILMQEKFVDSFIEFMLGCYGKGSNLFYIYKNNNEIVNCSINGEDIIYTSKLIDDVDISNLGSNEKVVIHGFYMADIVKCGLYLSKYVRQEQLVLMIYGADLYNNRYILKRNPLHPGIWYQEFLKKRLIRKAGVFLTFASPDYELIKEWYHANGVGFDILYPSNADINYLDVIYDEGQHEEELRILVGNSATVTNQHEEILRNLSVWVERDIVIICPLSYGDMEYAKEIENLGKELFGDKFVPITNYLDIKEYTDILNSVDIAIYNNNRQQGTGNIEILGYLGKKIYIRSDTATWGHYVVRDGCKFYDTKEIHNMTFEEFANRLSEDVSYNKSYFSNIWDLNYVKQLWDNVLSY